MPKVGRCMDASGKFKDLGTKANGDDTRSRGKHIVRNCEREVVQQVLSGTVYIIPFASG